MKRTSALIPPAIPSVHAGATPVVLTVVTRRAVAAVAMLVLATGLLISCDLPAGDNRSATGPSVTLAVVGQALIEHDPRQYLESPLATVAPILADADAVFSNLEVAVAGPDCACTPTRDDVYFHGAGPEVLDYLNEIGVSLLSLANNHSWDYGDEGIVSTVAEASKRGFTYAGTGGTMAEAVAPAYRDVGGVRVGLVALATVNAPSGAMRPRPSRASISCLPTTPLPGSATSQRSKRPPRTPTSSSPTNTTRSTRARAGRSDGRTRPWTPARTCTSATANRGSRALRSTAAV